MYELTCPRCGATLVKSQYRDRIGFACPDRHGAAMTLGAVRALCGSRDFANLLWYKSGSDVCKSGAPCPICRRPMRVVTLEVAGRELELDICRLCQEVWFDPHEMEALPPPPKPEALPQKAREALALESIRNVSVDTSGSARYSINTGDINPLQCLVVLLGLPVEEDAPPLQRLPLVTWSLMLACVAVFILTCGDLANCVEAWGFIPAEPDRRWGLTWLTSMFMHGGVGHLVGNMYFLWTFGDNVEDEIGKVRYLGVVLLSGLSALLLFQVTHPASEIPCVGASGFISGVIAMYAVLYPKVKIVTRIRWFMFGIPACLAFLIWMLFQFAMALLVSASGSGVAYAAHLGGALFGLLCGAAARIARSHRAEEFQR